MAVIESAWASHPGYRIDLVPCPGTARVWHGDVLLAESDRALRVIETDHVERLYFPQADVRLDLFQENDHHSICPFKGEADYWSLNETHQPVDNIFWTYRTPFDEVEGLRGHLGAYHEKVRVEVESRWPNEPSGSINRYPIWGDQTDLQTLIDAQPNGPNRFVAPGHHERSRNVVEGGQLLAQAIVAASKANPDQRVTSAYLTVAKAASFDDPIDLIVDPLRKGRTFSTLSVRAEQNGVLISPGLLLMDSGAPDLIRGVSSMPDVPGPYESEPYDMRVAGRDLRIVDGAYSPDPNRVGPPVIHAWIRFRDNPAEPYLRSGLIAQATTHWTIGAAMLPHPGISEAQAHVSLSTGIVSVSIAFHDDAPIDDWLLYTNPAIWSGRGLAQGDGRVFTRDGRLVASYSVQAMVRGFKKTPEAMGMDSTNVM
jgi:uncharacterized protein (DUF427 family)/acyl-CoA thioesterase